MGACRPGFGLAPRDFRIKGLGLKRASLLSKAAVSRPQGRAPARLAQLASVGRALGLPETAGGRYTFFSLQISIRILLIKTSPTNFPTEVSSQTRGSNPHFPRCLFWVGSGEGEKTNLRSRTDGSAQINYSRP